MFFLLLHNLFSLLHSNMNLLRYINRELGTPVNRFSIMAKTAIQGYHHGNINQPRTLRGRMSAWIEIKSYGFLIW